MNDSYFNQLEKIKILSRLKRIEGQIKGIQGMIIEERPCSDIMVQMAAAKSALNQVSKLILENHVNSWFDSSVSSDDISQEMVAEVMDLILRFVK
ncbi:Copper-sensing transcriptional repressor CsoR [subsurface metagenome]|uniref:Transcriptional regulator n=1 Tax=marine sediment metagenome TaxID=412755 RepID=X0Z9P7_9ZZZZ